MKPKRRHRNRYCRFAWDERSLSPVFVCNCRDAIELIVFEREYRVADKWFGSSSASNLDVLMVDMQIALWYSIRFLSI